MKFKFKVELEIDIDNEWSYLRPFYDDKDDIRDWICEEHRGSDDEIKRCVLDNIRFLIRCYALTKDEKLTSGALDVKKRILDSCVLEK
ncbi:MAG: hypothetical protein ACTSRU_12945 [Candidatus Hodarchaeales archaeon]